MVGYNFKKYGKDLVVENTAIIKRPNLVEVGNHVCIDVGVYLATESVIGDYVHIAPYTCIIGGAKSKLIMEDFSGVAAGSKIICGTDDFTKGMLNPQIPNQYKESKYDTVTFEKYSCVGVNCVVMPGVTLGEGSVVGAGSVITKDTKPWTVYVGSPAKEVGERDKSKIIEYGKILKNGTI